MPSCKISGSLAVIAAHITLWKRWEFDDSKDLMLFSRWLQQPIVPQTHMTPCKKGVSRFERMIWSKLPLRNEVSCHHFQLFSRWLQQPIVPQTHMSPCKKGVSRFGRMIWSKLPLRNEVSSFTWTLISTFTSNFERVALGSIGSYRGVQRRIFLAFRNL